MRFQQILYYASELQVGRRPKARLSDAHGQDWPVVIRKPDRVAAGLPLSALLSQVLAAFAIDYERERLGHLQDVSNFLRFVGDEGVPLARAQVLGGVSGNGKTAHERHVDVVVEPV